MAPTLTHICLHVGELAPCVAFYRRYCGLGIVADRSVDGRGSVYLADEQEPGGVVIQLMGGGEDREIPATNYGHLGFAVESRAIVDSRAKMARDENRLVWEPEEDGTGAYLCGVRDPAGNHVEFGFCHPTPP